MSNRLTNEVSNAGFSPNDIRKAIEASLRDQKSKSKIPTHEEQKEMAQRRLRNAYESGAGVYSASRPRRAPLSETHDAPGSSCNFKSIFKRGVKLTLGLTALGLASYAAYNNIENIQNVLGNLQGVGVQLLAKISELGKQYELIDGLLQRLLTTVSPLIVAAKDFLMNLSLQTQGIALGALLLLVKMRKAIWNNINIILIAALLAVVVVYVPEVNQHVAPYLAQASAYLTSLQASLSASMAAGNEYAGQAVNSFVENAKLINIQNILDSLQGLSVQQLERFNELGARCGWSIDGFIKESIMDAMNHLSQVAPALSPFATSVKDLLTSLPLRAIGKIASAFALLYFTKIHKAVATVVIFLTQAMLNHAKLVLTMALLAVVAVYVPEANQHAAPYLAKASMYLTSLMTHLSASIASNPHAAQAVDYLAENTRYIKVILFDLMILGFLHKAVNKCFEKPFSGTAHRLA